MMMKHIFLYGPPGAGKSSAGKALAERLHLPFVDLDLEIEKSAGKTIPQIMKEQGESKFRDLETEVLKQIANESPRVIALGGGVLLREENRHYAEECGEVVFLEARIETLVERLQKNQRQRPLLTGNLNEKLKTLLEQRKDHYDSFAVRVNQSGQSIHEFQKTPEQIALEIQQKLNLLCAHLPGGNIYDVIIQHDGFDSLGSYLRERELGDPVAVIADQTVANLYAEGAVKSIEGAGYKVHVISFPAGENSKNMDTIMKLWQEMLITGLDRKSTVVALGGGVTGDLAGFAASAFMRGINWVGVPSTLLAMVDSSLGGKTGFDLPEGKNLIGSFHSPKLVLADPHLLKTLQETELISGMAEVVKHGIISDPELFYLCNRGLDWIKDNLEEVIKRAMAVKIKIIEADLYEKELRATLNLGHTVGHAVELVSHFRLRHGEAVAIGMVAEAKLAERLAVAGKGLSDTVAESLLALGLPIQIPKDLLRDELIRAMRVDKKKNAKAIRFALPAEIGRVELVDVTDLENVLED
jgi:shikimate kinase / 3-dehydroquinate synthase